MDWKACIICQAETEENLQCPRSHVSCGALTVYTNFIDNVNEFRKYDALPVQLVWGNDITADVLYDNAASWHHSCHIKFAKAKVDRIKARKRKQSTDTSSERHSKRKLLETDNALCIFCGKVSSGKLHEYSTRNAEISLRAMANDMQDNALLTKISGGDLVAIEAKYHFSCLSEYRNRHRSYLRKKSKEVDIDYERVKAREFVEVVSYVEAAIEGELYMFKVKELRCLYQKQLKEFSYDVEINKSKFKESILNYFESSGIQEQSDGKNKILIFPEGIKSLLKNAFEVHDYQEEALLFLRVAKICRNELFKEENASSEGKFASNCQQLVPTIRLLISTILYGPDLNTAVQEMQVCNTVSQILMYNARKRKQKEDSASSRHSLKREPPVPLYVGLNIHTLTCNKGIIDRFEKLGLSVPYDRVLQVERVLAQNLCKQFREENIVCPPSLCKGLYTVADNIDHNPSSTTATGSLHGTAISIMQHVTMDNPGETREIQGHLKINLLF